MDTSIAGVHRHSEDLRSKSPRDPHAIPAVRSEMAPVAPSPFRGADHWGKGIPSSINCSLCGSGRCFATATWSWRHGVRENPVFGLAARPNCGLPFKIGFQFDVHRVPAGERRYSIFHKPVCWFMDIGRALDRTSGTWSGWMNGGWLPTFDDQRLANRDPVGDGSGCPLIHEQN